MKTISAADIARLASHRDFVEALRAGFAGDIVSPLRHHHELPRAGRQWPLRQSTTANRLGELYCVTSSGVEDLCASVLHSKGNGREVRRGRH